MKFPRQHCYLGIAMLAWSVATFAQHPEAKESLSASTLPIEAPAHEQGTQAVFSRERIGQATQHLFDMQRNPQHPRERSIEGEQASRSYSRYLKSFTHEIPQAFETGMSGK